jgi:hypothetical protein
VADKGALGILIGSPKVSRDEAPDVPDGPDGDAGAEDMSSPKARKKRAIQRFWAAQKANDVNAGAEAFAQAFDACMDYDGDDEGSEAGEAGGADEGA